MKKITKQRFNRKQNVRDERKRVYIFAEGKETEKNYFEAKKQEIRKPNIQIIIKGTGQNTLSLVEYALDYMAYHKIEVDGSGNSDECWVVFDKDDFSNDFDKAITKAKKNNLLVAYSNECFELWFLLHFSFLNTALGRKDFMKKLDEIIGKINGKDYAKKAKNMYDLIWHLEPEAIRNAKKLLEEHKDERLC